MKVVLLTLVVLSSIVSMAVGGILPTNAIDTLENILNGTGIGTGADGVPGAANDTGSAADPGTATDTGAAVPPAENGTDTFFVPGPDTAQSGNDTGTKKPRPTPPVTTPLTTTTRGTTTRATTTDRRTELESRLWVDRRRELESGLGLVRDTIGVDTGTPDLALIGETPVLTVVQRELNAHCRRKCKTELCYLADENDCRNFIMCQKDSMGLYHATLQPCAFGTYWAGLQAQRKITCDVPENVQCKIDYCDKRPPGSKFDHLDGNCKTHWECSPRGKPIPKCCGEGLMYSDSEGKCVEDRQRRCHDKCPIKSDACLIPGKKTEYYDDGNCRTYWNCEVKRPHPVCCPKGQGYDVVNGCVTMPSCNDTCPNQYEQDLCLKPGVKRYSLTDGSCRTYMRCNPVDGDERWCCPSNYVFDSDSQNCVERTFMNLMCTDECPRHYKEECHLKPDPNKRDAYLMTSHGVDISLPCPPGTEFNFTSCGCATTVKTSVDNSCNKELDITFDDPIWHRDGSQKQVIITEHGTRREGPVWNGMKSFRFDGDLYYRTPFFQSQYQKLYIEIVYMPDVGNMPTRQVLLSNCMNLDLGAPSLELWLQNGRLVLDLVTDNNQPNATSAQKTPVTVSVPYTPGVWNNFTAIYNGQEVLLLNDNEREHVFSQQNLTGAISVAAEGLDFGGCYINKEKGEGYKGSIAHLEFSKCVKQEWLDKFYSKIQVQP